MTNVLDRLTTNERIALSRWYDTDSHKALVKLIQHERLELAKDHVGKVDILDIRHLTGQSDGLKRLVNTVTKNYKDSEAGRKKNT